MPAPSRPLPSPRLAPAFLVACAMPLVSGCAVVSLAGAAAGVAGAAAGAAVSVAGAAAGATVTVAGKVVGKTIDVALPSPPPPAR